MKISWKRGLQLGTIATRVVECDCPSYEEEDDDEDEDRTRAKMVRTTSYTSTAFIMARQVSRQSLSA
jgi:hypothetical protein